MEPIKRAPVVYEDFETGKHEEKLRTLKIGNIIPLEVRVAEAVARNEFATIDLRKVRSVLANEPFLLDEEFLKQFEGKEPQWGELGWFTFKRTYARRVPHVVDGVVQLDENGNEKSIRTEEWTEVVRRVVEGNLSIIPNDPLATQEYGQKMFTLIWNLVFTPPGRGLWMSGTEFSKRTGDSSNNCWFVETRPWHYGEKNLIFKRIQIDPHKQYVSYPFVFLFDQSMKGGGVGFSAEQDVIDHIPEVANTVELYFYLDENHKDFAEVKEMADRLGFRLNQTFQLPAKKAEEHIDIIELDVADSREGWCEALAVVIDSHFTGRKTYILLNLSEIRERGKPIKGFGGIASGPSPLAELLHFYAWRISSRVGQKLTSVDVGDLHNATGRAVVAGNVRRTAEINFGTPTDEAFINQKNYRLVTHVVKGWDEKGNAILKSVDELVAEGYSREQAEADHYMAWAQNNHRWASNNSVIVDDPRAYDFGFIAPAIEANGEPGVLNRWLMQNFGRIIDGYRKGIDGRAVGGNPCCEISLESTEPCNLVEYMLPVAFRLGISHEEVIPFLVHYTKRVTFSKYDWESSAEVIQRNRRLGVSLSGVADWVLLKYGKAAIIGWNVYKREDWDDMEWLHVEKPHIFFDHQPTDEELFELYAKDHDVLAQHKAKVGQRRLRRAYNYAKKQWLKEGYIKHFVLEPVYNPELLEEIDCMYKLVKQADIEFSALLTKHLGYEVKPSIKVTTNKPSGTVALLPFVSPGVHYHYFKYGIRRIRVQESDPLLKLCQLCGYYAEPAANTPNTWVIEFPVKAPSADIEGFRSIADVTLEEQFAMQALMTVYWADNMVSCTITFHEHEKPKIRYLLEQYRMRIKSTSLLPYTGHGYVQAPYEPYLDDVDESGNVIKTAKEKYEEAMSKITMKPHEMYHILMSTGQFQDREMTLEEALECAGGACPVR